MELTTGNKLALTEGTAKDTIERFHTRRGIEALEDFDGMLVTQALEQEDFDEVEILTVWKSRQASTDRLRPDAFKVAHKRVRSKNEDENSLIINNEVIAYDMDYSYMK